MNKKEEFKEFARNNPNLINVVKSGKETWQSLYELYDIYGSDNNIWDKYLNTEVKEEKKEEFDLDGLSKHIKSAQKALGIVSGLVEPDTVKDVVTPKVTRPINKFFED